MAIKIQNCKLQNNIFIASITYKYNGFLIFFFQQIEEKVWKQINGASETDSPCWPTDELCLFGYLIEFILLILSIMFYTLYKFLFCVIELI